MYTLYGAQGAGSAMVEIALQWTGRAYEIVPAASWEPGPGLDALSRANPLAQIPTLVRPDGGVLTESAAILIALGLEHPASGLLPEGPAERALAIRGLVWVAANCYAAIGVIDYPERWLPAGADEAAREALRAGTRARLYGLWEQFADTFPARPFLGGEQPDALDLMACVVSKWSGARAHLARARPAFSELLGRIDRHPKVAEILERHWPG